MQPQEARRKRQAEAGPPGYRRGFSAAAQMVELSVIVDRSEKAVFDDFYQNACRHGASLFWIPDPTTDGWALLDEAGAPLLNADGSKILLSEMWLCAWGDTLPSETIYGQVQFRKSFSVVVMP